MIRQMREAYQGREAKPLPAMLFAGIMMEGGIIGYDSNTLTGGSGMRIFGIGANTQYQSDTVTVNLRTVSVSTGEILTNVTVTKTVLSYMDKVTLLRFINSGTDSVEGEIGGSINESVNKAIDVAVQAAVVSTINEGARKGHWAFKEEPKHVELISQPTPAPTPVPATKSEPKAEPAQSGKQEPAKKEQTVATADPKEISKNGINPVAAVRGPPPEDKKPPIAISKKVYLKDISYIYKETNDRSQKTWQFIAGTELTAVAEDGQWLQVKDNQNRGGWVLKTAVSEIPLAIIVNEPKAK
jgi:hypothetical protein